MNLGTVLQNLKSEPDPVTLLGEDIDLVILARASAAAGARGEPLSQYLQESVAAFLDHASEDEWAQLVGRLRDGDCGAGTCLNLMLKRRLRQEGGHACACG